MNSNFPKSQKHQVFSLVDHIFYLLGGFETWVYWREFIDVGLLTWVYGRGFMDVGLLTWVFWPDKNLMFHNFYSSSLNSSASFISIYGRKFFLKKPHSKFLCLCVLGFQSDPHSVNSLPNQRGFTGFLHEYDSHNCCYTHLKWPINQSSNSPEWICIAF